MRHMSKRVKTEQSSGFTLVEMLVIAPLLVVTIAVIVGFMSTLVNDTVVANSRTQAMYDVQNALTQIERDSFLGTRFLSAYTPYSPQGKDNGTAAFSTAGGDIIINQFGTTANPTDAGRAVVYYANQPEACSGQYQINQPFFIKVIYFLKTETDGTKSLYRRTIVPLNNLGSNNGDTTCAKPWQRSSCATQNLADQRCQAKDMRLVNGVSSLTTTYYNKSNPSVVLSDPTTADSLRVTIAYNKTIAGKAVTQTSSMAANRTNSVNPTPKVPTAPSITVYNPSSDTYNNPILTTFQWTSSYTSQYTYSYQINSGAWSTPVTTTATTVGIPTPYSNVTINLSVSAANENGMSTTSYSYGTPIWTNITLLNGWGTYGYGYATPQYTVTSAGMLSMKGLINSGSTYSVIFNLPVGLRPSANLIQSSTMNGSYQGYGRQARIDVYPNGEVWGVYVDPGWLSLDTVRFMLPTAPITWTNVTTWNNGWKNLGAPWQALRYGMDNTGRVQLSGVLGIPSSPCGAACNDWASITVLPVGYRPPDYLHIPSQGDANSTDYGPTTVGYDAIGITGAGDVHEKGLAAGSYHSIQTMFYPGTGWNNLTLQGTWAPYGGGFAAPQYYKAADGMVTVKGLVQNTVFPNSPCPLLDPIAILPPGYRPKEIRLFSGHDNSALGRANVDSDGTIRCVGATGLFFALDAIHFLAEQ